MINNRSVIILGLGPSGLFLTRQLHKLTDKIYAIGRLDDVGMYSKYIDKTHRFYASSTDELVSALKKISLYAKEKPALFISSDQYLTLLLSENVDWNKYADIIGSDFQTLKLVNDKQTIIEFCKSHNICTPLSYTFAEFETNSERQFPVIVKPNEKQLHPKKNPIGKVRICHTQEEFECLLGEMAKLQTNPKEYHIQSYIEGNNAQQYSIGGYYLNGEPLAEITVNQIKQYPQGISALVITSDDENAKHIKQISRDFAKELSFSGFMESEFKIDQVTLQPYLLDVNPRPWGWISVLGSAYDDFHCVFEGKKVNMLNHPVLWQSKIRRFLSFKNKNNADVEIRESEYMKAYDIFDAFDRKPSLMIYVMTLKKLFKK